MPLVLHFYSVTTPVQRTVQAIQICFCSKKILIRELILISGQYSVNYKIESSAETAKGIGYYPDVNLY
jgi:hypothetical protein